MKDYYAYMNTQGQPSYEINSINVSRDLDESDDIFLDKLQKEIAYAVPKTVLADRLRLYKNLIHYYSLKGSTESIQLFFRIIFNDSVEVYYPKDSLLIPSEGKWDPAFARQVYTEDPIVFVTGNGTGAYARATIENGVISKIPVTDGGSGYSPSSSPSVTITGGSGTGATAVAKIGTGHLSLSFPSGWDPGLGYVSGTVTATITGTRVGGYAATAEVLLNSDGSISGVYLTNAGDGYTSVSSITINGTIASGGYAAGTVDIYTDYGKVLYVSVLTGGKNYSSPSATISSGNATLGTPVTKNGAVSSIQAYDYGQDYTSHVNVEVLANNTTPAVIAAKLSDPADNNAPGTSVTGYQIINCGEGYPLSGILLGNSYGRYDNRKGFLSDVMRLQDSYFWQKYSYVIRTGSSVDTWKNIFDKLVHPTGFINFGEILLLIAILNQKSKMPLEQPGVAGEAERTIKILLEAMVSAILADTNYTKILPIENDTVDLSYQVRAYDDTPFAFVYGDMTVTEADGNQGATDPLYPYGNRTVQNAINNAPYVIDDVTYAVELV